MEPMHRWQRGDCVTLRYLTRDGRPGMAWPFTVVLDTEDLVALFIPAGSVYKRWGADAAGRRALVDAAWRDDVLRLMFPGRGYSIWLFWRVMKTTAPIKIGICNATAQRVNSPMMIRNPPNKCAHVISKGSQSLVSDITLPEIN